MPDDILNRIDDTLDDWNGSADSARWAGGPEESEWPEPRQIMFPGESRIWIIPEPAEPGSPTRADLEAGQEIIGAVRLNRVDWEWPQVGDIGVINIGGERFPVEVADVDDERGFRFEQREQS